MAQRQVLLTAWHLAHSGRIGPERRVNDDTGRPVGDGGGTQAIAAVTAVTIAVSIAVSRLNRNVRLLAK